MPKNLTKLLQRAYLGGLVRECVLVEDQGFTYIQAVDMSNSLYLDVGITTSLTSLGTLGLGDLTVLTKFLETHKDNPDLKIVRNNNRLVITAGTRGRMKYLLAEPEAIPTTVSDPDSMPRLVQTVTHVVNITAAQAHDIQSLVNTIKPAAVNFVLGADGNVTIAGGLQSDHQFELPIGPLVTGGNAPFQTSVYANHLVAVLNVLDWAPDPPPENWPGPQILAAANRPLIVRQDDDSLWALSPVQVVGG